MSTKYVINEHQLFEIFICQQKKCKPHSSAHLSDSIPEILDLLKLKELSGEQKKLLESSFKKFKKLKAQHLKNIGYTGVLDKASKNSIILENESIDLTDEEPPKKKRVYNLIQLDELQRKQLKRRTDDLFKNVKEFAENENVSVERLLGFLLTRSSKSPRIRAVGESLWNNEVSDDKISTNTCLTLYNDCKLGRVTYNRMRKLLDNDGFGILPPWNTIREKQKDITPDTHSLTEPFVGIHYLLCDAMKLSVQRLLPLLDQEKLTENLVLNIKFGFDGSGGHSIFNQLDNEQTKNIIMSMFCPLELKDDEGKLLWVQSSPNSPNTQRPVCLQMGKESSETLEALKVFNTEITKLENEGIVVIIGRSTYNVKVHIASYMMDMKAAHLYLRQEGAYCDLCTCSKDQCSDLERIEVGFMINRNVQDMINIFSDIGLDDGSVKKIKDDYDSRAGQTGEPIPTNEVQSVQVLHALLRCFDFVMKIIIHLKANVYEWSEAKTSHYYQFLTGEKAQLQQDLLGFNGVKWDIPDGSRGGTSTTGNTARVLLYNKKNRDFIIGKLDEKHQQLMSEVMLRFSVILRVMSTKGEVNVDAYKKYCTELYVILINNFPRVVNKKQPGPWISITPSVHKLLAHSWELMKNNDNHGLGSLDEAGLEGCNKILRSVRINLARKMSQKVNLHDTINRMWVASDPQVNKEREKTLPYCTSCNKYEHGTRYCPKKSSGDHLSEEDRIIAFLTTPVKE